MEPARVPRTRDYALRRAAAATNTSFFVAQARERAAARAAAKTKGRKQRRAWDATPPWRPACVITLGTIVPQLVNGTISAPDY